MKGAIAGFGFISGKGHFPAYQQREDVEIVAFADVCPARLDAARAAAPRARFYPTWQELLDKERELDFIDVSTPPAFHAEIALAALSRGVHVLCEKPLATSIAEARSMVDAARAHRRVVFPAHNYKHAPVVKFARETISSGRLGTVRAVTLNTFRTTHAKGVAEWRTDWRRDRKTSGGGIAMDHGSHTFYLAFDWLASQPTSITAKMSNLSTFDTEDNFNCTVTFPTGIAVCQLTWNAGFRKVIYTIHGAHGAIKVEDDDVEIHRSIKSSGAGGKVSVEKLSVASHWMDASHAEWFVALQAQFATQVHTGQWVGPEARDAAMCVQLIETAYASARADGRQLELSPERAVKAG